MPELGICVSEMTAVGINGYLNEECPRPVQKAVGFLSVSNKPNVDIDDICKNKTKNSPTIPALSLFAFILGQAIGCFNKWERFVDGACTSTSQMQ